MISISTKPVAHKVYCCAGLDSSDGVGCGVCVCCRAQPEQSIAGVAHPIVTCVGTEAARWAQPPLFPGCWALSAEEGPNLPSRAWKSSLWKMCTTFPMDTCRGCSSGERKTPWYRAKISTARWVSAKTGLRVRKQKTRHHPNAATASPEGPVQPPASQVDCGRTQRLSVSLLSTQQMLFKAHPGLSRLYTADNIKHLYSTLRIRS